MKTKRIIIAVVFLIITILTGYYIAQRFFAHRNGYFKPDYERVTISENTDYETLFLQTGLGKSAIDKLISEDNFEIAIQAQNLFFNSPGAKCHPLLGWFTREDRLNISGPQFVDLQPGDILVSLSTHSFGWRHGHAGVVIDENRVLEATVWGEDTTYGSINRWDNYTNYAVLRLKEITKDEQVEISEYASKYLKGIPYGFTAGFVGSKAPDVDSWYFSVQCSYLVWYIYNHFGYDLDSDGGRLVSTSDILNSDLLEVVQVYGMNPETFLK